MISLENVSYHVKKRGKLNQVLWHQTFDFNQDRIGLISDNEQSAEGVIDLLAGYALPQSGKIRRYGRVSWPIGRLLQFRSEMNAPDTIQFLCDIYRLDFKKAEYFILDLVDFADHYQHPVEEWSGLLNVTFAHALALLPDFEIYLGEGSLVVGDDDFMERWLPLFEQRLSNNRLLIMSCAQQVYLERFCQFVATVSNGQILLYDTPDAAFSSLEVATPGSASPTVVASDFDMDDF